MDRRKFIYNSSIASLSVLGLHSCNQVNEETTITILHTNDMHSQIDPFPNNHNRFPGKGGFARIAALIKSIKENNPNTLIFDAGDIFQGTPYFNFFHGALELELMSKMGYNASTIGNHEFDAGLSRLRSNIVNSNFKFICSNYDFNNTKLEGITENYSIYERSGVKIGVFGLGIELKGLVNPDLYKETKYLDPIEISEDMIKVLKNENRCDLIVCISHLGHYYNNDKISDIKLAKLTSDIDLIIGGHTHTFLDKPEIVKNKNGKNVIINQVGTRGVYVGRIDFNFKNFDIKNSTSLLEV
tara:strand:+ start:75 stop:971 length:897 start_codon:yes stop_codon:yes gene_type:complete